MGIKDTLYNMVYGSKQVAIETVAPKTPVQSLMFYDDVDGAAYKGTHTEEFWLNPPYGRPRNINFTELEPFEKSEWVEMIVSKIVQGVEKADWKIVSRKSFDGEAIEDSVRVQIEEATEWFENLPEEDFDSVLAAMVPDLLLYDAGVLVKVFPITSYENGVLKKDQNEKVLDLRAFDGRSFLVETSSVGGVVKRYWQYSWLTPSGIPQEFEKDEVLYFKMRPNSRGVYGRSKLEIIKNVVNYLVDAAEQGSKVLENGLFIGGQIDHPDIKDVSELQRKAVEYKRQLQGPKKSGKWLVTGGNVAIKSFPFTQEQMQWLDGQKWYARVVMAIFGVMPSELGFTDELNRATGMQQMAIYKSSAIRPILDNIERVINRGLVWKKWPDVKFVYPAILDLDDEGKQVNIDKTYLDAGVTTVNEIRKRDGKEPFEDEVFDKPFAQMGLQREQQKEDMEAQQAQQGQGGYNFGDLFGGSGDEEDEEPSEDQPTDEGAEYEDEPTGAEGGGVEESTGEEGLSEGNEDGEEAVQKGGVGVVEGKIEDIEEREEKARVLIGKFWEDVLSGIEKDLEDGSVEGFEEFGKGGVGSGIKGHRTERKVTLRGMFDNVLYNVEKGDFSAAVMKLNLARSKWSSEDFDRVMSEGACEAVNSEATAALKKRGINTDFMIGKPKDKSLPPHYVGVIEYKDKKYIVDLVAGQFSGYGVSSEVSDNKAIHPMTQYKPIWDKYEWEEEL